MQRRERPAAAGRPSRPWAFDRIDAVVFDMDGVVTDTAAVHAEAWKELFDAYLEARSRRTGEPFRPFDSDADYRPYVDGKPRYDGVRSFLVSRGIELPEGDPSDPPDRETICGLGNRKNRAFLERLHRGGARAYDSTVELVGQLNAHGIKVGVISASENMNEVLASAGLESLFDVRVDGADAARLKLPGKPDPAVFLEAARRMAAEPLRAAVVEDALAGVEAGRRGDFALVVGVDRTGHPDALAEAGADIVVGDLRELLRQSGGAAPGRGAAPSGEAAIADLPSALEEFFALAERLRRGRPAVFLDYDGTLTPIVAHPSQAVLPAATRKVLLEVARRIPLAIISGRDLADVRALVEIGGIWYAGSHGFDIESPDGERYRHAPGATVDLDRAEENLRAALNGVPGAWVERKAFAIAVHFRQTPTDRIPEVEAAVEHVAAGHPTLRRTGGKRVLELRPSVDWDKGRAVLRLLEVMALDREPVVAVYVGDDLTDEDAFRAIHDRGIGVVVRGEGDDRATAASFSLAGPDEVASLLVRIADAAEGSDDHD